MAELALHTKLVSELSEAETERCAALTLPTGLMRDRLHGIRKALQPRVRNLCMLKRLETETAIMISDGGELVAWALVMCVNTNVAPQAYLFVRPDRRRQGLGRMLADAAARGWEGCEFHAWDETSTGFFEAIADDVPLAFEYRARRHLEEVGSRLCKSSDLGLVCA
jgi:hypothetical protein